MMYPEEEMGMGSYIGEIREGPDGNFYQWVEGIDGFGNPIGFWKALKRGFRAVRRVARIPVVRKLLPAAAGLIPGIGPAAAAGVMAAQRAGILGLGQIDPEIMGIGNYIGEVREGPDGELYQWEEGIDGFGNPIGFWKALRRIGRAAGRFVRGLVGRALVQTATQALPAPYRAAARTAIQQVAAGRPRQALRTAAGVIPGPYGAVARAALPMLR